MPDDRETPKPRPPGPKIRAPDSKPDTLQKAGDRFTRLSMDLVDAVNSSGGFEPSGPNSSLRPVLRAAADNFAAAASGMSEITRSGIESGHLTDEDLDLIAEVETWAAHFRIVNFTIQRALGDQPPEPGEGLEGKPGRPR